MRSVRRQWQSMIGYVPQSIVLFDDTVRAKIALSVAPDDAAEDRLHARYPARSSTTSCDGFRAVSTRPSARTVSNSQAVSGNASAWRGRCIAEPPGVDIRRGDLRARQRDGVQARRDSRQLPRHVDAHRLSTVRRCDRLYYLDVGTIVAHGSFERLRGEVPAFARMVDLAQLDRSPLS